MNINRFITNVIDAIDNGDMQEVFIYAYHELDNSQIQELLNIFDDAHIDYQQGRENAFRFILTQAFEGFQDHPNTSIRLELFQNHYLLNRLGYSWDEFVKFVEDNASEWSDIQLTMKNGRLFVEKDDDI